MNLGQKILCTVLPHSKVNSYLNVHTLLFLAYTVFATKLNEYCNHAYLSNVTLEKCYKSNKHNFISIKLIVFINKFKFQPTLYDFFFKIEKLYDLIEILKKSAS